MLNSAKIDEAWQELGDDELWARVQSKQRWFVTADKEFADLRRYPPGNYAGLILLRASDESRARYLSQIRLQHTLKANPDATAVPLGADRSLSFRPGFPLKQLNGLFACCHNAIHEIKKRGVCFRRFSRSS